MLRYNTLIYGLFLICISLPGCRTNRDNTTQDSTPSPEIVEMRHLATEDALPQSSNPMNPGNKSGDPDMPPEAEIDSLYFRLERTPCYGTCPVYILSIFKSGYVVYQGINFVDNKGTFQARISKIMLQQIADVARDIRYFELNDNYVDPYLADLPSTITFLRDEARFKKIVNGNHHAPKELLTFEKYVDNMFTDTKWSPLVTGNK